MAIDRTRTHHRPSGVTLLIWGVLSIAVFNLVGFAQINIDRDMLSSLLPFPPFLLGSIKLFWAITGLILAWGLYKPDSWAPRATYWVSIGYSIYFWVNRLLLFSPSGKGSNTVFLLTLNGLALIFIFWILRTKGSRMYFGEQHGSL